MEPFFDPPNTDSGNFCDFQDQVLRYFGKDFVFSGLLEILPGDGAAGDGRDDGHHREDRADAEKERQHHPWADSLAGAQEWAMARHWRRPSRVGRRAREGRERGASGPGKRSGHRGAAPAAAASAASSQQGRGPTLRRAHLSGAGFSWDTAQLIPLQHVVAVICTDGSPCFTVHAYPSASLSPSAACSPAVLRLLTHTHRHQATALRAPSAHSAWCWLRAFAGLGCVVRVRRGADGPSSSAAASLSAAPPAPLCPPLSPAEMDARCDAFLPVLPLSGPWAARLGAQQRGCQAGAPHWQASGCSSAWELGVLRSACVSDPPPGPGCGAAADGASASGSAPKLGGSSASAGALRPLGGALLVCRRPSVVAVVLNPKSGRGRARAVYHKAVKPVLELAGFRLCELETRGPQHAVELARSLDPAAFTHGIVCVGGDGLVNEVLNGLYQRPDAASALSRPLGVIPAGSDNALAWSALRLRLPLCAALAVVRGLTRPCDAMRLRRSATPRQRKPLAPPLTQQHGGAAGGGARDRQSPDVRLGLCCTYFGFMSDVLQLCDAYQPYFGPARYFAAGVSRVVHLPSYSLDVEFLPAPEAPPRPLKDPSAAAFGALGGLISAGEGDAAAAALSPRLASPPLSESADSSCSRSTHPTLSLPSSSSAASYGSAPLARAAAGAGQGLPAGHRSAGEPCSSPAALALRGTASHLAAAEPFPAELEDSLTPPEAADAAQGRAQHSRFFSLVPPAPASLSLLPQLGFAAASQRHSGSLRKRVSPPPPSVDAAADARAGLEGPSSSAAALRLGAPPKSPGAPRGAVASGSGGVASSVLSRLTPLSLTARGMAKVKSGGWLALGAEATGEGARRADEWGAGADGPRAQEEPAGRHLSEAQWGAAAVEAATLLRSLSESEAELTAAMVASADGWVGRVTEAAGVAPEEEPGAMPRATTDGLVNLGAGKAGASGAAGRSGTPEGWSLAACASGRASMGSEGQGGQGLTRAAAVATVVGSQRGPARGWECSADEAVGVREGWAQWVSRRGPHLGVMLCNHRCSTVQCLPSQALAPDAAADDGCLHLLVVRPLQLPALLRFLVLMQWARHLTLPRVECVKVTAVRIHIRSDQNRVCGVDGELLPVNEEVLVDVQPSLCRLYGTPYGCESGSFA